MTSDARQLADAPSSSAELGFAGPRTPTPFQRPSTGGVEPQPEKIRMLCEKCWDTFSSWGKSYCGRCGAERPARGWATLPYTFRDRYLFWEPLGRGGMGAVFLAYDEHQLEPKKKAVAVKVVPASGSPELQDELKRMFEREASAGAMLAQSPCFVKVTSHDVGVEPAYLVMEYVRWPTLRRCLRRSTDKQPHPFPAIKVARIGIAILRGLSMMHYHRIVHRDLKPDNIFVRRAKSRGPQGDALSRGGYDVKILDFGVWTRDLSTGEDLPRSVTGIEHTSDAAPVGTYSYMSPEQMAGKAVGARSDIHTIGSVLWELATGTVPYKMKRGDERLAIRQRFNELERPPERPADMPEGLFEILVKALALGPEDRWESADEMRAALKVWLAEQLLRTREVILFAGERLERLEERIGQIKQSLSPAQAIVERLDVLTRRVGTARGQVDEADPATLLPCIEETEQALSAIAREIRGVAKNVEERILAASIPAEAAVPAVTHPPSSASLVVQDKLRSLRWAAPALAASALLAFAAIQLSSNAAEDRAIPPIGLIRRPLVPSREAAPAGPRKPETVEAAFGTGHAAGFVSVAYSPDGRYLLTASADLSVVLRSAEDAQMIVRLLGHEGPVLDAAFSPDSKLIASAGEDGIVRLWEVPSGRAVGELRGHRGMIRGVRFSPDGRQIATAGEDGTTRVWSAGTGKEIRLLRASSPSDGAATKKRKKARASQVADVPVRAVAYAPEGGLLVSAAADGALSFFDTSSGELVRRVRAHENKVHAAAFTPDGRRLASAGEDGTVRLWDPATGQKLGELTAHDRDVRTIAFSSDGRLLASGSYDRSVRVWRIDTEEQPITLSADVGWVYALSFSPDARRLAVGGHDRTVRIFDIETRKAVRTLAGREGGSLALAMHPSGEVFATAGYDRRIVLVRTATGALAGSLEGHAGWVEGLAFSPDGRWLASAGHDRTVKIWDARSMKLTRDVAVRAPRVRALAFTPAGGQLASAGDEGWLALHDAASGRELRVFGGHSGTVDAVAFVSDPTAPARMASAGDDRTIRIWDPAAGAMVRTISAASAVRALAFSPNGQRLAAAGDDHAVRVFDAQSGALLVTHGGHTLPVHALAFSPGGALVASAGLDGAVNIWSADSHRLAARLDGHELGVEALAFAPDGDHLVSAGNDGTRRIWSWGSGSWLAAAEGLDGWTVLAGGPGRASGFGLRTSASPSQSP